MNILVTGGLGFIGSNLINFLIDSREDAHITNVDNFSYGSNPSNLSNLNGSKRYSFIRGDICDPQTTPKLVENADIVVNLAAETHVDRSIRDPSSFYHTNTFGVLNLLDSIRKCRKEVIFLQVGTDEVYGDKVEGMSKENDLLNPSSPYSASKASADLFALSYWRTYGMKILISRCSNNFGPRQFPEKFLPKIIVRALLDLEVPIYGAGQQTRDWLYVIDHCEALRLIMEKGKPGSVYNISAGNEMRNIDLAKLVLDLLGKPRQLIRHVEDRPGHDTRYSVDSSKIRSEIGWEPQHPFPKTIQSTIQWYKENKSWWQPLANEETLHPTPWKIKLEEQEET